MSIFKWDDSLLLGIKEIDKQHKEMLVRINKLLDLVVSRKSKYDIGRIIRELNEYADNHFEDEEELMKENNYVYLDEHRKEHDTFRALFKEYREKFKEVGPSEELAILVLRNLNKWWVDHIIDSDKKYIDFIKK